MTHPLRHYLQPGIDAVRALWLPFVLIQFGGLLLVIAYFHVPAVATLCERCGEFKARIGFLFAAMTMPIACGFVPEVFKFIAGVDRRLDRKRLSLTLHNMGLYVFAGTCVDLFYTGLGVIFRDMPNVISVPAKVLIDQLLYTPIIGVPLIAFSFTLRDQNYRPIRTARRLGVHWYEHEVLPVMVMCWAYWFPMTILMYTLPPRLTFVYGLVASSASSVLLNAVAGCDKSKFGDAHA